jgi:hypothetical protein
MALSVYHGVSPTQLSSESDWRILLGLSMVMHYADGTASIVLPEVDAPEQYKMAVLEHEHGHLIGAEIGEIKDEFTADRNVSLENIPALIDILETFGARTLARSGIVPDELLARVEVLRSRLVDAA